MFDEAGGAISVGEFERHGQARLAQRPAIGGKLALLGLVVTFFGKGHGGEAIVRVSFPVKIGVNVPSIEGGIKGRVTGAIAEALFRLLHQWEEVGDIALIKGLRHFGDDKLTEVWDLSDNDAGTIPPVVFTDLRSLSGNGIARGCWWRSRAIVAAFTTQAAIGIADRLLGLVVTLGHIHFGVVFLHPSDDMFGVE